MPLIVYATPVSFFGNNVFADRLFCDLTVYSRKALDLITRKASFPHKAAILRASERASFICTLVSGDAWLFASKKVNCRRVQRSEIFGITESFAKMPFGIDLEAITDCVCGLINCQDFENFLRNETDVRIRLLEMLASEFQSGFTRMRSTQN